MLKETLSGGSYSQSEIGSGLNGPTGVAVDGAGNVYIADYDNSRVVLVPWTGGGYGTQSLIGSGLSLPQGVAVDGSGNVYIADSANNRVLMETLTAGGYTQSSIPSSELSWPYSVAVDGSGNVYIADFGNSRVLKETFSGTGYSESAIGSGLNRAQGVAVDGKGNVYIADTNNSRVLMVPWSGSSYGAQNTIVSGLNSPQGLTVDGGGNVYIDESYSNRVLKEDYTDAPILSFAATNVGSTSSDSPQQVTLLNFGNATLNAAEPGLTVPTDFTLAAGSGTPPDCTSNFSLITNASCNLSIDFVPTATGAISELLVLTDNALNVSSATQSIALNGTGIGSKITPTITWTAPAAITYGAALSATQLDATSGGVDGTFVYTPPVGTVLDAGVGQTLFVAFTPSNSTNYNNASGSTTITVNKATPVVTWSAPSAITYGTALSATQLDASSGGVDGTFVYTPPVGTVLDAGAAQTLSVAFTPSNSADYNNASGSTSIAVNKATPVVALISSASTVLAKTPATFTATVSSSSGTPSGSVSFYDGTTLLGTVTLAQGVAAYTTSSLAGGSHSVTAAYAGDSNFSALTSAAVTETVEDFAVTIPSGDSSSATVSPGGAASYTLTIAPSGGATFPSAITLAVSGLPAGATATFTPTSLAAGANATNIALAIQTSSQSASLHRGHLLALQASALMLGMLLLPFGGKIRRVAGKHGRAIGLLLLLFIATLMIGITGCGGSGNSSKNYTLTMTATSGTLSHSTTLTLTVK